MRAETSSVAELPEMHLMGHTCTNLNGDLMFVWGGTNENVAYSRAPNTDLWIYETLTGYWRHRKCSGECPPYLSSCSSALIGQKMYIFGGHSTAQDNWLNCLYCLDLDTFVWRDLGASARGEPTKPIRSDKNVAWSYGNRMYVFGGYGWSQVEHYLELTDCQADLQLVPDFRWPKFGWNNQLVEYNPSDKTWRWPRYRGKCPTARAAHSGALMGNKYFVFGGRDSHERLNDLYTLDMESLEWQRVAVFSSASSRSPSISDRQLTSRRRAIGHLLAGSNEHVLAEDAQERHEAAHDENNNDDDDDDEHNDEAAAESHRQLVEEMYDVVMEEDDCWDSSPSSSSTCAQQVWEQANISGEQNGQVAPEANANDEDEEDFEYPHPSHLLERWSLSSRNPLDSDQGELNPPVNDQTDNGNNDSECLYETLQNQHQQDQEQNFMPITDRTQERPALATNNPANNMQVSDQNQVAGDNETGQRNQGQQVAQANQDQQAPDRDELPGPNAADDGLERAESLPAGRSFCSLTPISHEHMLLFGGVDSQDKNLDDCWIFNINTNLWTQITDYKHKRSRLWHTGAKTRQNEVVIMGGSSSEKIDEFCSDVFVMSFEPKSLKRLALDIVSRSVRMKTIQRTRGIPSTLVKLIKLRKQAMALTMRRSASQRLIAANVG